MKKITSVFAILISALAFSQISVSGKAHLLFPTDSPSWKSVSNSAEAAFESSGKTNMGFNVGISVKVNLASRFFIMPEFYYTTFKNEFTDPVSNTTFEAKSNRVDVPVLLGMDLLGEKIGVFIGPVASYILKEDNQYNDFVENAKSEFTVGYQLGAQLKFQKIIISGKYEGALSEDQREFFNENTSRTIRYDNRPSLFQVGIGYQF